MMQWMTRAAGLGAVAALAAATPAAADKWNDRTILSFSEPIMVPGATLQPGRYVFKLVDSPSDRNLVRVLTEDQSKVITTTHAVPTKRRDARGDVVLRFDPTEPGSPPALRAWFYPGSLYGHEFVYPEKQAREIAERTRTVVLSAEQAGTDMDMGTLRTYGPSGERVDWHGDPQTMREWNEYRGSAGATAANAGREERRESSAPIVQADLDGMDVTVDQLEDGASRYLGKQVRVTAEVEDVLGPRLFTIDEARWGDLEGEILVRVPGGLAALVREDDAVSISGTVTPYVRADVEREWNWFGLFDDAVDVRLAKRPVLVADRIVGGDDDVAMVIKAVDGDGSQPPVTDIAALGTAGDEAVGRRVALARVTVAQADGNGGFVVKAGDDALFMLPARGAATDVKQGDTVAVRGVVLQMPRDIDGRLDGPEQVDADVYVLATAVDRKTPSSN